MGQHATGLPENMAPLPTTLNGLNLLSIFRLGPYLALPVVSLLVTVRHLASFLGTGHTHPTVCCSPSLALLQAESVFSPTLSPEDGTVGKEAAQS